MDRFTEYTTREEKESELTCWECGDDCDELHQAPWDTRMLLVGACCLPVAEPQRENLVTPEERAALDAEELALFGPPAKFEPMQGRLFPERQVA